MRHQRSLSRRVALIALVVIGAWLVMLMTGLNLYVDHKLRGDLTTTLRVKGQAALATVVTKDGRIASVRDAENDTELDSGVWIIANDHVVSPSGADTAPAVVMAAATRPRGAVSRPGEQLLYVVPITANGSRIGAVVVAASTDGIHRAAVLTLIGSLIVGGLLLAGIHVVMRLTVARALRPVADMTDRAADWSVGDPSRRFGDTQRYLELTQLGHSLDAMLDRVSAVLRHEQSVTAELSHELRTPLSRIKAEAELLAASKTRSERHAIEGIQDGCTRMERIIDTLLTSARTENAAEQGRCEVSAAIEEVTAPWRRDGVQIDVTVQPSDLHAGIDLDVCERIIAPIVDNAVRFAASRISIVAAQASRGVTLDISNDGPAIPAEQHERIFTPGASLANAAGARGAGLGLALSRRLARAADGDVTVHGGDPATFRILLPG